MSIAITRYVDITSGVGGASALAQRSLVARIFSGNSLIPPQTFISFDNAASVASYFGVASEEYQRALFYFSFISKTITTPQTIQFAKWNVTATAPSVASVPGNGSVIANWASITNGSFGLTINGVVGVFSGLDFATAVGGDPVATMAEVATFLQTTVDGTFSGATVTVNSSGDGFVFTGGVVATTVNLPISVQAGLTGTDITGTPLLGWLPAASIDSSGNYVAGALTSAGSPAETVTQTLTTSAGNSNDFGSFLFLNNLNLSLANAILAATWNTTQNNTYMYCVPVTSLSMAQTWAADSGGLGTFAGTAITLSGANTVVTGTIASSSASINNLSSVSNLAVGMPISGTGIPAGTVIQAIQASPTIVVTMSQVATASGSEQLTFTFNQFPEQIPMMVLAATPYNLVNSVQNYMFQGPFAGLSPLVTTDSLANSYDALSVNYYGSTQQAGQIINFYQTGVLQGTITSPLDMTSYANEMWLKDALTVAIMNQFIGLTQIPANAQGRGLLLTAIQSQINNALNNGTISVNKTLTTTQQQFIATVTNDPEAWYQVQNSGYWVDCEIIPPVSPSTAYTASFTLVYSKDDVIRLVNGRDILI